MHSPGFADALVLWFGALDLAANDFLGCDRIALHPPFAGNCKIYLP
jgi:hypothetical protein